MSAFRRLTFFLLLFFVSLLVLPSDGWVTWYHPGMGACGIINEGWELIAAASWRSFQSGDVKCGDCFEVTGRRGSIEVTIVDKCGACGHDDLDLTEEGFMRAVGDLGVGKDYTAKIRKVPCGSTGHNNHVGEPWRFSCSSYRGHSSSNDKYCQGEACEYCLRQGDPHQCMVLDKGDRCRYIKDASPAPQTSPRPPPRPTTTTTTTRPSKPDGKCSDYSGVESMYDDFCVQTACPFCISTGNLEGCMKEYYTPYCKKGGKPSPSFECSDYKGVVSDYDDFCRNDACGFCKTTDDPAGCMKEFYAPFCTTSSKPRPPTSSSSNKPRPPTTSTSTKRPTKATTTKADDKPDPNVKCWAPNKWHAAECKPCPNVVGSQCAAFSYTACYSTKKACERDPVVGGGGGAACTAECPDNTSGFKNSRPSFKGPHCYNSKYGSRFGPSWKPSGRTNFEKYLKTTSDFQKAIYMNPEMPVLRKWGLSNCQAATAVYENFVCALELIEARGKKFEGPRGSSASVTEFAGASNDSTNRLEVAAFFSHKFKETGRLTAWEEAAGDPYVDASRPYTPGRSYHGRGPVQISWNNNYGDFSQWFYGNNKILLDDPDMVDPEGPMGFIAALWFWFTPRQFTSGAPISGNIRTRDAIVHWTDGKMNAIYKDGKDYDAVAGLALSTNVINGGIECSTGWPDSAKWRVEYFLHVANRLGAKIPSKELLSNKKKCLADKFCRGLYVGCRATNGGLTCNPTESECGLNFIEGWQGRKCSV